MSAYSGQDVTAYEGHIQTLKEAFEALLPEFINKGRQQEFTTLKESFPRVRSNGITDAAALARAVDQDEVLLTAINRALASYDFIKNAFENQEIGEEYTRDEDTAMQTYNVLHAEYGLIQQSLRTSSAYDEASKLFEEVIASEYTTEITLKGSQYRDASENDKRVLKLEIETACQKFNDAKRSYRTAFQKFDNESLSLARLRKKTYNINFNNNVYLNAILCQETAKAGSLSLSDYFERQEKLWAAGLQFLAPTQPPQQVGVAMSPARSNQSRSQFETRKFTTNRIELGRMLEEITQEMENMRLEELQFSLKKLESRHKVVEDLSLDPDVIPDPDSTVLADSTKLQRSLVVKIASKVEDKQGADERRKHEANANLKALGNIALPDLTGFSDFLPWKRAQEKLNTHVDDFKKAAVLLGTLKNPDDKRRCVGIYNYI